MNTNVAYEYIGYHYLTSLLLGFGLNFDLLHRQIRIHFSNSKNGFCQRLFPTAHNTLNPVYRQNKLV